VVTLLVQRPPGSLPPIGTLVQVPTWFCTTQLVQVPVDRPLHAVLQHTPSVQLPLRHWFLLPHDAPLGARPQLPLLQTFGLVQSAFDPQVVRQRPVDELQVYTPQSLLPWAGHASPLPSQ